MGHTADSDRIRDFLLDKLRDCGKSVQTMNELASKMPDHPMRQVTEALGRSGRNVFMVNGVGLINVHVRSEPPGWWGILKSVKEDLDFMQAELGVTRYFVLLVGRKDHYIADGYIITDFEKSPLIKYPSIGETKRAGPGKSDTRLSDVSVQITAPARGRT